ncbi:hypothetical protein [Nocardia sp. XZ_19_385]|uniref:hypothetical protein n=1 Tax=Nocardia sp. XZ_19_385 TaxID=2769488 RepID=UPI00188F45B4|nr:hypothetical protein [Nocardia sp. XZ_19_385]
MKRVLALGMLAAAVTGIGMGTASAKTIDAGSYSSRAACEQAGKAQLHGEVKSYRCSATSPIPGTNDYNYNLYLETKDPGRPCSSGGTGSASASSELFCLFL